MKHLINYLLLGVLAAGLGCETNYPDVSPELFLGTNDNITSTRRFETCTILYSMTNFTGTIDQTSQQTALKNAAELWGQTHGHLELMNAAGRTPSITVTFTDSANFTTKMTKEGLISQPLKALSTIKRTTNGSNCTILLLKSYDWKLPVLQRVLLYQMGVSLGLQDSNDNESAMSLTNTYGKITLSKTDSIAITTLYDQPCDEWTKIETQIPLSASNLVYVRATFSDQIKGYCIIDLFGGKNKVVEFNPALASNNWTERSAFPGIVSINSNLALVSFTVGSRLFVGNLYSTQTGKFWEYIPAKGASPDNWKPIGDCPHLGADVQVFGIGNKGYLISKVTGNGAWFVWTYDPTTNKWTQESSLGLVGSGIATRISDLPTFLVNETVYIVGSGSYWRFSPTISSAPWQKVTSLGISGNFQAFSTRNYGFLLSTQLWRFNEKNSWQLAKAPPVRLDFPDFVFSIAKRVFIYRNGVFYRYNP